MQQPDALGHVDEHAVAGLVAQAVVDLAEAVQVDQQQRKAAAVAPRLLDRLARMQRQLAPVGQPRERIGERQLFDALLRRELLAQVAERIHPAHRLAAAPQRARHALQHLAAVQRQALAAAQQRGILDRPQPALVVLGFGHALLHPAMHGLVVVRGQQRVGHGPDHGEAAVEGADAARQVGDQDAVGGGSPAWPAARPPPARARLRRASRRCGRGPPPHSGWSPRCPPAAARMLRVTCNACPLALHSVVSDCSGAQGPTTASSQKARSSGVAISVSAWLPTRPPGRPSSLRAAALSATTRRLAASTIQAASGRPSTSAPQACSGAGAGSSGERHRHTATASSSGATPMRAASKK